MDKAAATIWRPWAVLAACSVLLFVITAATFSSLGIVMPRMVEELGWSWHAAALGYTFLGGFCGASSFLPAILIRRIGVRATVLAGSAVMVAGFVLLAGARAHDLIAYLSGTALLGVGYQMMALIPGTHVLAALFAKRGLPFGIYFTLGALGGVAGPLLVVAIAGQEVEGWRQYWLFQAAASAVVGIICAAVIGSRRWLAAQDASEPRIAEALVEAKPGAETVFRTRRDFSVREALRTPQFYIIAAAYFSHLLCGATAASLAVGHLSERGVATAAAATVLSAEALLQTAARLGGGFVADRIDPRRMLILSQGLLVLGMLSLAFASGPISLGLFAVGTGAGFGLTVLAVTILLLNYYGKSSNLEIFSLTCTVGAVSATGPYIGGFMRDRLGGFEPTFLLFGAVTFAIMIAAVVMRPPQHKAP